MDIQSILQKSIDYVVFTLVLIVSLGIGIYNSFKQKSTEEYLHGRRKMGLVPVTISLLVSYVSAISMQGLPAEVYLYGLGVMLICFSLWGICLSAFTFIPIFYDLQCTSIFEYLELRFESAIPKNLASVIITISTTAYSGIILIGPASALESLCGIPTDYNIIIMAVVCTLYTSIGGIRGVIWTDVFQAFVRVGGCAAVLIIGVNRLGMSTIWDELEKHGRTKVEFSPNPTLRNSFWICLFGLGFDWFTIFSNQTAMVRYTSLPSAFQAKLHKASVKPVLLFPVIRKLLDLSQKSTQAMSMTSHNDDEKDKLSCATKAEKGEAYSKQCSYNDDCHSNNCEENEKLKINE